MAGRRGRPAKAQARRRQTTKAGRRAPDDRGTRELQHFRRALLNGHQLGNEVVPLTALFSRGLLDQPALEAGLRYSATVHVVRHSFGLSSGSVSDLWRRLVAGVVDGDMPRYGTPGRYLDEAPSSADQARIRLDSMNVELQRHGEDETMRRTVMNICVDLQWGGWVKRILCRIPELSGDWRSLGALREGLQRLADMRAPRRREASDRRAEAAE
jgi:hypothetical protein